MKISLKVWRQKNQGEKVPSKCINSITSLRMSFLEMFDILNADLIKKNEEP